jgi:hypothetical protein
MDVDDVDESVYLIAVYFKHGLVSPVWIPRAMAGILKMRLFGYCAA